jgi:endogenous inhibitor of DNA gyrase (YacG/DUF329 family)
VPLSLSFLLDYDGFHNLTDTYRYMKCTICETELTGRQTKYCSRKCKGVDTNHAHQSYSSQQKRGEDRKIKLVNMMGGKCKSCGYDRNYSALSFHHRDPDAKEHTLDLRQLSNRKWDVLVSEASKCDLLCMNCHMEHHHPQHKKVVLPVGLEPTTKPL